MHVGAINVVGIYCMCGYFVVSVQGTFAALYIPTGRIVAFDNSCYFVNMVQMPYMTILYYKNEKDNCYSTIHFQQC